MSFKLFKENFFETIIIVLTFILNPFLSLIFAVIFVVIKNNEYLNFILIINISLFIGLLNTTKVPESDLMAYKELYLSSKDYTLLDYLSIFNREYIFYFFSYLFGLITGGSWKIFILFTTFISYFLILKSNFFIFKTLNPKSTKFYIAILNVSFLFILFSHSAHLLRNFIAGSFVIYFLVNFYFLNKIKWWAILIAFFIHSSAGLFVLVFLLPNKIKSSILTKRFSKVLILFFASVFIYFTYDIFTSNYQINRILEIYSQKNSFEISELFYALLTIFFIVSIYLFIKNIYVKHASSILNYIKLIFVLVTIAGFSLFSGVLIGQRILLFLFIFCTIFLTMFIITKKNISQTITPIITIIVFYTFINNFNYGVWEYASVLKIFSNSLFSYF
jgi:hypothetical protein